MKAYQGNGFRVLYDVVRDTSARAARTDRAIRGSDAAVSYFVGLQHLGLVPSEREAFCVLLVNARHRTIGFHVVSIGTLNQAPVHPREVFRPAIAVNAAAIILAHNHPTGDQTPSIEDRRVTDRMQEVGELIGISVLDHVVIGAERYYSFADGRSTALALGGDES